MNEFRAESEISGGNFIFHGLNQGTGGTISKKKQLLKTVVINKYNNCRNMVVVVRVYYNCKKDTVVTKCLLQLWDCASCK